MNVIKVFLTVKKVVVINGANKSNVGSKEFLQQTDEKPQSQYYIEY